jgi:hypothetical protein
MRLLQDFARLVLKMFVGMHKTRRMALALTFLGRCPKDGDDFLQHIVLVTGNEI